MWTVVLRMLRTCLRLACLRIAYAPSAGGLGGVRLTRVLECPRNTRIPGRRPGRRLPGIVVGIVSALKANFRRNYFKNLAGSAT